ncbi:hypothetical protein [Nocardia sp. NPDC004604]|uniref:hypothetical protein n=1 Tax=Nocardia sp. NPDC004604 TaxID=3157013 RepID=UPI0033B3ACE6
MYENFKHHGGLEQVEEFYAAAAPTAPPTVEQLTEIYESMRTAGWEPRPTL